LSWFDAETSQTLKLSRWVSPEKIRLTALTGWFKPCLILILGQGLQACHMVLAEARDSTFARVAASPMPKYYQNAPILRRFQKG
jgi:hypothetical protein